MLTRKPRYGNLFNGTKLCGLTKDCSPINDLLQPSELAECSNRLCFNCFNVLLLLNRWLQPKESRKPHEHSKTPLTSSTRVRPPFNSDTCRRSTALPRRGTQQSYSHCPSTWLASTSTNKLLNCHCMWIARRNYYPWRMTDLRNSTRIEFTYFWTVYFNIIAWTASKWCLDTGFYMQYCWLYEIACHKLSCLTYFYSELSRITSTQYFAYRDAKVYWDPVAHKYLFNRNFHSILDFILPIFENIDSCSAQIILTVDRNLEIVK